jgi:hypothetical protein
VTWQNGETYREIRDPRDAQIAVDTGADRAAEMTIKLTRLHDRTAGDVLF